MKLNNETKIGILVVAVVVMLGYLWWEAGDYDFTPEGYELIVQFKNIDGVEFNAPVTVNGFEVGRVKDIKILYGEETRVQMTLWLDSKAKLHEGATARVKNMGFLGEKYIGLSTGEDNKPFLRAGSVIQGKEPSNMEDIMAEAEVIAGNLKEITANINERLKINSEAIDDIIANFRVSMRNITSISGNVNERLEVNKLHIDDMIVHLNGASANLEEMSEDLKENPWKLLYKPKNRKGSGEIVK